METVNLCKLSVITDYYVSKKQYNRYKTDRGRLHYLYRELTSKLNSLIGQVHNGIEIRYARVESNDFWAGDKHILINDIGYNCYNKLEKRTDDKLAVRQFMVDIIGIDIKMQSHFNDVVLDDMIIMCSSYIKF